MRPFTGFASNGGMTGTDQLGSRSVGATHRVGRQFQLEARLNEEQSAQLFANVMHKLVRLGEIDLADAQAAVAALYRLRSTDACDAGNG
jgi:hypothetical protein